MSHGELHGRSGMRLPVNQRTMGPNHREEGRGAERESDDVGPKIAARPPLALHYKRATEHLPEYMTASSGSRIICLMYITQQLDVVQIHSIDFSRNGVNNIPYFHLG